MDSAQKKHTLLFCCSFHIRSKAASIPKSLLIYCAVVILSQLTFKGRGKSAICGVKEGFIIRGDPAPFEGPSSACGKVFDPDYWFPAPVSRGSGVNGPEQKRTLVKSTTDLTQPRNVA